MRWLALSLLLGLHCGCGRLQNNPPSVDFELSERLVRYVLGETQTLPTLSRPGKTLQHLARLAEWQGKRLRWTRWSDVLRQQAAPSPEGGAVLLVHRALPPQLLLDISEFEQRRFALLYDLNQLRVADLNELRDDQFEWAVWVEGDPSSSEQQLTSVDSAKLTAERGWTSLGAAEPNTSVQRQFALANRSAHPLRIRKVHVGCSCVAVEPSAGTLVPPGETVTLTAEVDVGIRPTLHEVVTVEAERSGFAPELTELELFGWSPGIMEVAPEELDFGWVDADGAKGTVRLVETAFDRFEITSMTSDGVPLQCGPFAARDLGDLREYTADLRLDLSALDLSQRTPGEGVLRITTTSRYVPTVEIPVRYRLKQLVKAQPAFVDFGMTVLGEVLEPVEVSLRHLGGEVLTGCEVMSHPELAVASVVSSDKLAILPKFTANGFHAETVVVRASWESGSEDVEIKYSGLVTER